tara:strand:+ start:2276 stop:2863 length:588 start_codon:yes stop_codon:yes gene_type:complete
MSLASRAADLYYAFRFIKLLTTKWDETDAYKLGIIDADGKRIKSEKLDTSDRKAAYSSFNKLVYNLKRLLNKVPGGSSVIASYAAAILLLREHSGMSQEAIEKVLNDCDIDTSNFINEANEWFLLEDKQLAPGIYRVRSEKLLNKTLAEECNPKDRVRVYEQAYPIDNVFGIDVYEGVHINTNQKIYVSLGEIYK